jgi:hypothetical protein
LKALKTHHETLVLGFATEPALLTAARRFAAKWAGKHYRPNDLQYSEVMVSESACYEKTRSEGGATAARGELLKAKVEGLIDVDHGLFGIDGKRHVATSFSIMG